MSLQTKKNKKGLSIMIGYVLLITGVIVMSTIVYQGLKTYVPKEVLDCPDGTSIFIKEINCIDNAGNFTLDLTLKNNGRFNIAGYFIRATDNINQELAIVDLSKNIDRQAYQMDNMIRFDPYGDDVMTPGDELTNTFNLDGNIYSIEIIPTRFQEEEGKIRLASCGSAKVKEKVVCGPEEGGGCTPGCSGEESCVSGTCVAPDCGQDSSTIRTSCLDILNNCPSSTDGTYWINPTGSSAINVNCDMTRDGGGWTQILKTWYVAEINNVFKKTGAVGSVSDGLTNLGSGYKLSDESIRQIIGPNQKFDILADQSGYNSVYSTGNYEYVILRGYTGYWKFDGPVSASTTTTIFQSYRKSDNALAWTGNLQCGYNAGTGAAGINCYTVLDNNPKGGSGCDINMGLQSNGGWHHFFMSQYNEDTYMYICNGAQHTSNDRFSQRFWVRESS
ncbi:MAG: fibrinogen-like YCDxxxxGGGW domain-containing protein [Nanoarchaeota archaeon]